MMGCNAIRKQIDEADRPDAFSFEVSAHFASCEGCRSFADERANLRGLLASATRVQAPAGFDAALRARLEAAKSRRVFSWLAPAALLRMGAAATAVVIVVFVAQYAFQSAPPPEQVRTDEQTSPGPIQPLANNPQPETKGDKIAMAPLSGNKVDRAPSRNGKRPSPRIDPDLGPLDPHLVIVRGERGDREVPIFTVSVGAQPHLYGTSRPPQAGVVKASF